MKKLHLGKKVVSFLMVIAMVFSLLPSIITYSVSAAETQSMTIHWQRPSNWTGWETPAIYFWGGDAEASNYVTSGKISGWGENDIGYTMTEESDGWYTVTLTGTVTGFQFLDFDNPSSNSGGKGYVDSMKYCTSNMGSNEKLNSSLE